MSRGGVPEWLKGTGCKPVGYAYPGSNPGAPTTRPVTKRVKALQHAHIAQSVEHFLGKEEVTGSSPVVGSIDTRSQLPDLGRAMTFGGVAQLVRARGSYPRRRWFESSHRYQAPRVAESRGA